MVMGWCYECKQEIPDHYVGLINFGYCDHYPKCPIRLVENRCRHCGKDL